MNILIIEDEQVIANRLLRMTKTHFAKLLTEVNHCDTLDEGLKFLDQTKVDLLLLDLNLNGEDGFDILKNVVSRSFHTIVVSAYKDKAIEAFEYGVLDFVPKPFNEKRLSQAFERTSADAKTDSSMGSIKFLSIIKRGHIHLLELKRVKYIKGARAYTEVHLKDGSREVHNKSLDALIQLLPSNFERIHKSYIADMHEVKSFEVESGGKYALVLKSGDQLPIGRAKYKELRAKYLI